MPTQPHYRRGVVLNLAHFDFDIVSDFDIRISDFSLSACPSCRRSTIVERALQIALFLQNKANFKIGKMTISTVATKSYPKEQRTMSTERHAKQTQSNPISPPSVPNFVDKSWPLCHHINNCVYWTLEVVLEVRFGAEKCRQSRLVLSKENSYEE